MSAIRPEVQHAIGMFLETLEGINPGCIYPPDVIEHRRMMAATVLTFIEHGDASQTDLGDLALASLARATIGLCDDQQDGVQVAAFANAARAWIDVNGGS